MTVSHENYKWKGITKMDGWKPLDLRKKGQRPEAGAIVVLYLMPNNKHSTFYRTNRYDIGQFEQPDSNRKLWWHGTRGTVNPVKLKQHYDIWWYYAIPFNII